MKLKNVDNSLEKIDNMLLKSLSFLDNKNVYISIIFILFLYNTCMFKNINYLVSDYYNYSVVKVIVLLLIIYISRKSCLIALLLTISFLISLNYKTIMENFVVEPLPNSSINSETENFETPNKNSLSKKKCDENYLPKNLAVGNVCNPVSTFENELNTQGLNDVIGYDKQVGFKL